jgi:hypothetical protein
VARLAALENEGLIFGLLPRASLADSLCPGLQLFRAYGPGDFRAARRFGRDAGMEFNGREQRKQREGNFYANSANLRGWGFQAVGEKRQRSAALQDAWRLIVMRLQSVDVSDAGRVMRTQTAARWEFELNVIHCVIIA